MADPNMTPEQALSQLAQELSASASEPLLDNDDPNKRFSLRGAIRRILWKVNQQLNLSNRPVLPTTKDDLYGHVLSLRAEHLSTQAVLFELAGKLGVDVKTVQANVKAGLNVKS